VLGQPQFAKFDLKDIPNQDKIKVDLGKAIEPAMTASGKVVTPGVTKVDYTANGEIKLSINNENPGKNTGKIVVRAMFSDGTHQDCQEIAADIQSGDVIMTVPSNLAVGSVRWQLVRQLMDDKIKGNGNPEKGEPNEFPSDSFTIAPPPHMAAALTRTGVQFIRENRPFGSEVRLVGLLGNNNLEGTYLTGAKAQPIAYSGDLSRVFIGGKGLVYVIYTITQKIVDKIIVDNGENIGSLVCVGNLLIVGESSANSEGASGARLLAFDVTPKKQGAVGSRFKYTVIQGTGIENSPNGVTGMVIGPDGKTLVVAVPNDRDRLSTILGRERLRSMAVGER